jgi:hypothetical protein
MARFLILSLLVLCAFSSPAQQPAEDVLYLKNGWVLRGRLLSAPGAPTVKLQTADRSVFVFARADVDSLRQEAMPAAGNVQNYKRRGFAHFTELGALAGRNTSSSTNTSAFSFQTVNGFKFNQWLYTGLGVGVDLYATQSLLPLFGSVRGDFLSRGTLIPFYFVDAGYGINITGEDDTLVQPITYSGGGLFASGVGLKVLFSNSTSFLISVGYRSQRTTLSRPNTPEEPVTFQRIAVRAGFAF